MKKKSILIITAFPPNSRTAGQNYTKNLILQLSANYQIDVICFQYQDHEYYDFKINTVRYIKKIPLSNKIKLLNAINLPLIHPFFSSRFSLKTARWIKKRSSQYHMIYFDFSQCFLYAALIKHRNKILMCHDIIFQKYHRDSDMPFYRLNINFIRFCEQFILKKSEAKIFCLNQKDKKILSQKYGIKSCKVDLILENKVKYCLLEKVENYFCLFGAWNRPENIESLIWLVKNIYNELSNDFCIKVIGGGITSQIKNKINKDRIFFTGFIDNPYPIIASSKALLAPIFHGAGVKVKVIEAIACGTPVIGTSVALEGIEFKNDLCIKANNVKEFLSAVERMKTVTLQDKLLLKKDFLSAYPDSQFNWALQKILN